MATLQQLADDLGTTPAEIVQYLDFIGVPDLNGWQPAWQIHASEERDVREHWTTDPTPQEQWRNTDGAPDTQWSED